MFYYFKKVDVNKIAKIFDNLGLYGFSKNKFYIDRSDSKSNHSHLRKIINEKEVKQLLINKGFSVITLSDLSFKDQINLFYNAKQIVGAHGAAFANLVFCKKDTKIVEIKPTNRPNLVSKTISKTQNLNFNLIETDVLPENKKRDGDIILNKNLLDKYL